MRVESRLRILGLQTVLLLITAAAGAQDHPNNAAGGRAAEARSFLEQGFFDEALTAANVALSEGSSREDMISALETMALVHLAIGNDAAMRQTLVRLLSLAPEYVAPSTASPDFTAQVDNARGNSPRALQAQLDTEPLPSALRMTATLVGDPGGLSVRAALRARGQSNEWQLHESPWEQTLAEELFVQPVVLGPAQHLVWTGETEQFEPPESNINAATDDEEPGTAISGSEPADTESNDLPWIVGTSVGAALLVTGIVVALVLTLPGETQYAPRVQW